MQQWMSEKQAVDSSLSSVGTQEEQDHAELSRLQQLLARESQQEKVLSKRIMVRDILETHTHRLMYIHSVYTHYSMYTPLIAIVTLHRTKWPCMLYTVI